MGRIAQSAKRVEKTLTDNSPHILTGIAATGVVTTAYLAGKASFKAAEIIAEYEQEIEAGRRTNLLTDLTPQEKIEISWKLYIPAFGTGVLTLACIFGANQVGTRRAAAMAAAWSASDRMYSEYKEKVLEHIGDNEERKIREKVTESRIRNTPPDDQWEFEKMVPTGDEAPYVEGSVLCFEEYTGRYFMSDMELLKKAQNDTNYQILHENYASLSDFYARIGLSSTTISADVGWNTDHPLELSFTSVLTNGGAPCLAVDYEALPTTRFFKTH